MSSGTENYSEKDQERFLFEPAKRAGRTEFMRDRARVIHSAALRRLAAKTQVAVPWENDFQRTRLSHSLECAQIGRELGESLGADPDLLETACLSHDLGHPPFGHNGEEALAEVAKDFGGYDDDVEIFNWMRQGAPSDRKCIEAQIMDWSDDCAYSVHDLEDAIFVGQVKVDNFERDFDILHKEMCDGYGSTATKDEAAAALQRLQQLSCWPRYYDGSHRSLARLKDSTSQLIGRFVLAAELETRKVHGNGALRRYEADLVIPREQEVEVDFLKAVAGHYLINAAISQERYAKQQIVIKELVEMLHKHAATSLDSIFVKDWERSSDETSRMRIIIDQVASLTDPGAYALHARLSTL